jgi:hypothetical protein
MAEPLFLALTADVDPDANRAVPGRADAVSAGGPAGEVSVAACGDGLRILLDVLAERNTPATLFWEGRTLDRLGAEADSPVVRARADPRIEHGCHGWRHEDFAGKVSGRPLDAHETRSVLARAAQAYEAFFDAPPRAFRAPYCRLTPHLAASLEEAGYRYDASATRRPSAQWALRPYRPKGAGSLWELALCRCADRAGRPISGYLWQLFEGRREARDFVDLAGSLRGSCGGGLLQLALHPWHLVVGEDGRPFDTQARLRALDGLRAVVDGLVRLPGLAFTSAGEYLARACPR